MMELINDIYVNLKPGQNFLSGDRVIEVDVSHQINFSQFALQPNFSFDDNAFSAVRVDESTGKKVVIAIKSDIVLSGLENELAVRYYANSQRGDNLSGKIIFPEIDFGISVNPITFELDACCSLPDKIIINVRDYNGGSPITLTGVGDNDPDAGTITLTNQQGNDYNDDFNEDFGTSPNQIITYTLNKTTDFWKTLNALDRFRYDITINGKTASNFITTKLIK